MSGRIGKAYWPDLSSATEAEKAVKTAAYVAFFVAAITTIGSLLTLFSVAQILPGWSIVDALVFAVLGVLILRGSRVAAVLGLSLYVVEVVASVAASGNPAGLVIGIFFGVALLNGVRGANSLKRIKENAAPHAPPAAHGGVTPPPGSP
ncbi:MAG TPA: hypothetical protein VKG23_02260 [Thermoanaerobaculia bacterium]|nr:hypothetical protein [Thermoanaerobaculia bacterium]